MSTSTRPIIVPSDSDIEDDFSSTHTPDYTPPSPDYFPALPGNTSPDPSDDLSKRPNFMKPVPRLLEMGHNDEVVLARVRNSTPEILIDDIQIPH
ncbi:hypothetical protein Tco_1485974 [Tanacetum coccineum]